MRAFDIAQIAKGLFGCAEQFAAAAALDEAIRATAHGLRTFLVTAYGELFTDGGFGNRMRDWCDQAELPQCTAHGLKKAAATICAELGAADHR